MPVVSENLIRVMDQHLMVRDWDGLRPYFTDDVIYHIPGHNPIAGDYRGVDAVIELLARWMEHTDHFRRLSVPLQSTAGDEHILIVTRRSIIIHGQRLQWVEKSAHFLRHQQIAVCWLLVENVADFNTYWSYYAAPPADQHAMQTAELEKMIGFG